MTKYTLRKILNDIENDNVILTTTSYISKVIEDRSLYGLYLAKVKGKNMFICCDNSGGNAWTEQFNSFDDAINYLLNKDYIPF